MNWQNMTAAERLWARVDRRGPDECWPFRGATKHHPYGQIRVDGKDMTPARFAYILANGSIPDDKDACHTCDTPPCCNARHIFAGTHRDNMRDMCRKLRHNRLRGRAHPHAVLSEEEVRAIKTARQQGATLKELAAQYKRESSHLSMICTGRIWRHVSIENTPAHH